MMKSLIKLSIVLLVMSSCNISRKVLGTPSYKRWNDSFPCVIDTLRIDSLVLKTDTSYQYITVKTTDTLYENSFKLDTINKITVVTRKQVINKIISIKDTAELVNCKSELNNSKSKNTAILKQLDVLNYKFPSEKKMKTTWLWLFIISLFINLLLSYLLGRKNKN